MSLLTALKRHGSKNLAIPRHRHRELVHIVSATSGFKNSIGVTVKRLPGAGLHRRYKASFVYRLGASKHEVSLILSVAKRWVIE